MGKNCPAKPQNHRWHALVGDKAGQWAIIMPMTLTKNLRLTFIKIDEATIADLNLEDYH
jgi:hypothetical protein